MSFFLFSGEHLTRQIKGGEGFNIWVVALLIPVTRPTPQKEAQAWAEIDHLAAEIGARWPMGISAAEAVTESRR